ncbi:MAG: leucyl aminopeptidase, partial [Sutterella sp.]|nr:leucyl aminopeptidase [Sutterella sp.]
PMPVGPAYEKLMKSNAADIANQASTREGGASSAAAFLSVFTEGVPWAHLDIAATANTSGRERASKGRPVPLLLQFLFDRL